jgi:methyl-accepting chemotaxis protein
MMEIICESCGKKYRIDEGKMTGAEAKVRCTACKAVFTIQSPEAAQQADTEIEPGGPPEAEEPLDSKPEVAGVDPSFEESREPQESSDQDQSSASEHKTRDDDSEAAGDGSDLPEDFRVRFGLTAKVVTVMLLVSLIPLLAFGLFTLQNTSQRVQSDTTLLMGQISDGLMNQVDEWLDKNARVLQAAANMPAVKSMDQDRQESIMKAIHEAYPYMYLVFTVKPDGMNLARNDDKPVKDYSDRQYYQDVMQGEDLAWQTLIGKTSKKPALVMAVPIQRNGQTVGVMASAMTVDRISQSVADWSKGDTGFAFLVDETGKVVAHQMASYVRTQKNLSSHPLVASMNRKDSPHALSFEDRQGDMNLGYVRGNSMGWVLGVQQEHTEVYKQLKDIQLYGLILLGATALLVTLVSVILGRRIVTPIKTLTEMAERISLGELNVTFDIRSKDEIGLLAKSLARMQTSIRLAMRRFKKKK